MKGTKKPKRGSITIYYSSFKI